MIALTRMAWALACAAAPRTVGVGFGLDPSDRLGTTTLRVLGVRELVQSAVTLAAPRPAVVRAGAVIDALHVLSMLPVAVASRRYRRPALTSAAATTAWAALSQLDSPQ
jgi:hypothetical protein